MARVVSMLPVPSPESGPMPWSLVYLRWKSCRPRRMARKGSRLMMNMEDSDVITSPRPVPACWAKDLLMPASAVLGVTVLSGSCARLAGASHETAAKQVRVRKIAINCAFCFELMEVSFHKDLPNRHRSRYMAVPSAKAFALGEKRVVMSEAKPPGRFPVPCSRGSP
jgi:hypothetical protein